MEKTATLELILGFAGILLTVVNLWLLTAINALKSEIATLRATDVELSKLIAAVDKLVAGQYVTRTEFKESMQDLKTK
jgi:hypothetical protein